VRKIAKFLFILRSKLSFAVASPVLCLAIMFLVTMPYGASAANNRPAVVVTISGRLDGTTDAVPNPRCAGQLYPLSGTPENGTGAVYKGTLDGVGGFCTQAKLPLVEPDASGFDYHEQHTFVGTVQGCGTGTFRYSLDGVLRQFDADNGYFPADEYWSIVEGSGTADLVGIRSGLNHRTAGVKTDGTVFALFDPAMNSLSCIPARPQSRSDGAPATASFLVRTG
jgi:hypothetical protein